MKVQKYTFNPFATNTFIIHDKGEAVIIDGSAFGSSDVSLMSDYIEQQNLSVKHLILTHGHIDHILGCRELGDVFGLTWRMNSADRPLVDRANDQARMFGIDLDNIAVPTEPLNEGDTITFGSITFDCVATPGHSPGSISLIDRANRVVVAGDVLFNGSIGRTDLWKGSLPELMQSIFQKILVLEDDFHVLCGHGPDTSVGHERSTNPFLQERR